MPVLRSRQIPPLPNPPSPPKTLEINGFIEPTTPSNKTELLANSTSSTPNSVDFDSNLTSISAPPVRRSNRLASKPVSEEISWDSLSGYAAKRRRMESVGKSMQFELENDKGEDMNVNGNGNSFDGLGFGSFDENSVRVTDCDTIVNECLKDLNREEGLDCLEEENGRMSLRSGTKLVKNLSSERETETEKEGMGMGKVVLIEEDGDLKDEGKFDGIKCLALRSAMESFQKELDKCQSIDTGKEEKGKGIGNAGLIEESGDFRNEGRNEENGCLSLRSGTKVMKGKGKAVLIKEDDDFENEGLKSPRRRFSREEKGKGVSSWSFSREEKGKGVQYESDGESDDLELDLAVQIAMLGSEVGDSLSNMDEDVNENVVTGEVAKNLRVQQKDIARRNAMKYAHFNAQEEEENAVNDEDDDEEMQVEEPVGNVEDWPGPFSTAMKIIRDREKNSSRQVRDSGSVKGGFPLVSWTPRKERNPEGWKRDVPSLLSLCLNVLAENVDAITSLESVPDALRNKLSRLLCDSRQMNPHFLSLLLEGSPSEIRLADCSWLEERVFEKSFEACDIKNMTVLQLDLCGHCVSDSSLRKALVPKGLEALTTISLKGACRISDDGLGALVSSAPALRSMNLSQCSLLTEVGIENIANSLGSVLEELYLDDCETLDAMRILPKLQQLKALEVLSLRGVISVSDKFIKKLFKDNGQNMKELILANCVNLTDVSLKAIADTCSQLRVLDLSCLGKLSDIGMAYITNGCRSIQDLKLCRSPFSDDAIAAFLETSGESLIELSLNNISKVGQNTTLSLARRCKNLESLDLSWCRLLTNEALGLIADSCLSLRLLKLFGCTQVTEVFVNGHSNPNLHIVGLKLTPILNHIKIPDFQQGPLHY